MRRIIREILFLLIFSAVSSNLFAFDVNKYWAEKNFNKGFYNYQKLYFISSIADFKKSLEYNTHYHLARIWLGRAYYMSGFVENAINEWKTVIDLGGGNNLLKEHLNYLLFTRGVKQKFNLIEEYEHLRTIKGNMLKRGKFYKPTSIIVDHNKNIYVTGIQSGNITILDANGEYVKEINSSKKKFLKPFDIVFDKSDNLWVSCFKQDRVVKLDRDGNFITNIGKSGNKEGEFYGPEGLAIDGFNNLYVVDSFNHRIQKFNNNGMFLMSFGSKEILKSPSGIVVDSKGYIYITDFEKKSIIKFDADGNLLQEFGAEKLQGPRGIKIFDNKIYIADAGSGVHVYDDETGKWFNLYYWNNYRKSFKKVMSLAFSRDRFLYIADMDNDSIEVFVNKKLKLSNLSVRLEVADVDRYPRLVHYISVNYRNGKPVIGLKPENFWVKENGIPISPIGLSYINQENRINFIFLVQKSKGMESFQDELSEASDIIINQLNVNDSVSVINYHSEAWKSLDFDQSKLRIKASVMEYNYKPGNVVDKGIMMAVNNLIRKVSRTALIIFTDGSIDYENSFASFNESVCYDYARINHIPIYIINLKMGRHELLFHIANKSGGKYYSFIDDYKSLEVLRETISKKAINQYILIYSTVKHPKLTGKWKSLEIGVEYEGLIGKDVTGYFHP